MLAAGSGAPFGWDAILFLLPFVIGILSGGQGIYGKLGAEWIQILRTVPGWLYWVSRGLVPAACYWGLYAFRLDSHQSLRYAIGCGVSTEVLLRSQFFVGSKTADGRSKDVFVGLFGLLEFYQDRCLIAASNRLASGRLKFMRSMIGEGTDFPALCEQVSQNIGSFAPNAEKLRGIVTAKKREFNKEPAVKDGTASLDLHRRFSYELGFSLLLELDRKSLRTLFAQR